MDNNEISLNNNTFDFELLYDSDLKAEPSLDACCCCSTSCCCTAATSSEE